MGDVEARRVSQREDECRRLKRLCGGRSLDKQMLQEVLSKKTDALCVARPRQLAGSNGSA
jgi:hypothetical protein